MHNAREGYQSDDSLMLENESLFYIKKCERNGKL